MLLVPNHHVIVPNTLELAVTANATPYSKEDIVYVELFGDSILCGKDPDLYDPECGCDPRNTQGRVPQPPARLLEVFLPQYRVAVTPRTSGLSTARTLLDGNDGINRAWPDNIEANIVVINHGLNDAKNDVPVADYENTLRELRNKLPDGKIMVWQTPTVSREYDTSLYADAMKRVATEYDDVVADAHSIGNWLGELPDGIHPRQLGYAELVDLCLSSAVNRAILRHQSIIDNGLPHPFLRKDYQEKHVLDGTNWLQLNFKPLSHSWVEVYYRDNVSYRAVSRGLLDERGILTSGLWDANTTEKLADTGRSYGLVKIKRDSGRIAFKKTYDVYNSEREALDLANELNETNDDYIVVITTFDEPKANRLIERLANAMYRCGASGRIFGSEEFKYRSSYILVGIPGCGEGNGLEAYNGLVDGLEANIANVSIGHAQDSIEKEYYPIVGSHPEWTGLLNSYGIWDSKISADLIEVTAVIDSNVAGDNVSTTIKSDGILNKGTISPVARWFVSTDDTVVEIIEPIAPDVTSVNVIIGETPDCALAGMQFGIQGISYVSTASVPKLELTTDVDKPFTIETVIWPLENQGGMIINKDSEYEMALDSNGNIMVALDWGVGTDVSLPGGGWYMTPVNIPWNLRSHIAWIVNGTTFDIYVDGVLRHTETNLDRIASPSASPVVIGNRPGAGQQFYGYIMDVRIWDRALTMPELNITKRYFELLKIPFYVGVAPLLENFVPDYGTQPDDDLVLIGDAVTEDELLTYGIYSTITDLPRVKAGYEVAWETTFTAWHYIKIGYWHWDIRKYPKVTVPEFLYEEEFTEFDPTTKTVSGIFTVPDNFTSKSIIVFGVGDWDPVPPTGMQNVSMTITSVVKRPDWDGSYYHWQAFFPSRGDYVFSLSCDNRAYLDITFDRTNAPYERVVDALNHCKGYDQVATAKHFIPKCGWYNIRVYAENIGDVLGTPEYYDVPSPKKENWSPLLARNAVYIPDTAGVSDVAYFWEVYLKEDEYDLELSADDYGVFYIKGGRYSEYKKVLETGSLASVSDPKNYTGVSTRKGIKLIDGWYTIKLELIAFSTDEFYGIAARILSSKGGIVWTTRYPTNPRAIDKKGVAATATSYYGNAIVWHSRMTTNERDYNDLYRRDTLNPRSFYSEIEFELTSNGTPFPIDIYPPVPKTYDTSGNIVLLRSTENFDIVSNVPPVNGTRMINARYTTLDEVANPDSYRITYDNRIVFTRPLNGVVTVVCDSTDVIPTRSVHIDINNIQSYDYYRERFHPARYAAGYDFAADPNSMFGKANVTGNTSPRPATSTVGVTQLKTEANVYNAGLNKRVGDSHYAEPIIISQPMHGFARITRDRQSMSYTPFPGFYGRDAFSYTLLSQIGQAGMTKCVHVEVVKPSEVSLEPPPPPGLAATIVPDRTDYTELYAYFEWTINLNPGVTELVVTFDLAGTMTPNRDFINLIRYAPTTGPDANKFTFYNYRNKVTLDQPTYKIQVGPIINDKDGEPTETLVLIVKDVNGAEKTSTVTIVDA